MATLMQRKLQRCAKTYNRGTLYCEKLYITYMAVWSGHQKINLKFWEILNQEVRMLLYMQQEEG
jgi:hypothetical protein